MKKNSSLPLKISFGFVTLAIICGLAYLASNLFNLDLRVQSLEKFRTDQETRFFALKKSLSGDLPTENGMRILFRIHGSNTIGDELAPNMVSQYMRQLGALGDVEIYRNPKHPERIWVRSQFPGESLPHAVEIYARGSSTAFDHLDKERCHIGMSSRGINSSEEKRFAEQSKKIEEHIVALDGIAVIVHPQNPLNELSQDHLIRIFSGQITNWAQLGGKDQPISLFVRDSRSGTLKFFQKTALLENAIANNAKQLSSHKEMMETVLSHPGAIGFVSLPFIGSTKSLALKSTSNSTAILPNTFSISTEDYLLSRRLYLYAVSANTNLFAREFLEFSHSESGQASLKNSGFVALDLQGQNSSSSTFSETENLPTDYKHLVENASRLSINFRFIDQSQNLTNRSIRDMIRLVRHIEGEQKNIKALYLIGFSDNEHSEPENLKNSGERAEWVKEMILSSTESLNQNQIKSMAMGSLKPIAPNNTPEGREKNRRVEIWLLKN